LTLTNVSGEEPPSAVSKVFADITADGKPFMTKFARLFADRLLAMDSGWFRRIAKAIDFLGNTPKAEDPHRTLLLFNETLPEGERFCTSQRQSELEKLGNDHDQRTSQCVACEADLSKSASGAPRKG
jgi:hypothetical protein